ncbi:B3/B4 domain-containing protein [Streptomyces beijiangensis]|uniref:B3/B4 tRNA-binding domain-containing protein n=1 Tax=Streptomyces beijiangensis TaxID=163361 RepID=A0A939F8L2_9ACTN|nr:phenylalanine--tRNA ligase beta subunit-related protein [Streptomyces beijiangensis]MBO0512952.1 hypothetical protein [Streptomyces beijiangensis]
MLKFSISEEVSEKHPGTKVAAILFDDLTVVKKSRQLDDLKRATVADLQLSSPHTSTDEDSPIQAWRRYYRFMGIDPVREMPAPEGLVSRVAENGKFPTINSLVDCCNLVVSRHLLPIGAFDRAAINGDASLRLAHEGERMIPIGGNTPKKVPAGEVVYADAENIFSRYSHDSDLTKVTAATKSAFLVVDATSEQSVSALEEAAKAAVDLVSRVCGGSVSYQIHIAE